MYGQNPATCIPLLPDCELICLHGPLRDLQGLAISQEIPQSAARFHCPCLVHSSHSVSVHSEVFMLLKRIQKNNIIDDIFFFFLI